MKNASFLVLCSSLLACGFAQAQHIEDGKLVFPERRIQSFVYDGVSPEVIAVLTSRITTLDGGLPGSWGYEWNAVADHYHNRADELLSDAKREDAMEAYLLASTYYSLAGFPEYHSNEELTAFRKHLAAYRKAGELMQPALQVVPVTARGKTFDTYFHRPAGIERPPLILWTNGTDKFKGNAYRPVRELLDLGFAVVTFDLPGTGESTFWKLTPDGEFVHLAVLDHFAGRDDVDTENIFQIGISFGGYFAARMATKNDSRLKAIAAVCGPVHDAFVQGSDSFAETLVSPEGRTVAAFARRVDVDPADPAELASVAEGFSLVNQGLITSEQTIHTPLLIVNGGRDGLAPISDMQLLASAASDAEVWTLGMAPHCAKKYFDKVLPDIAEWLIERGGRKPD